jgi:hypothetical protein
LWLKDWVLVVTLIASITVIMAWRSELDAFCAHISTLTTDNPQVDPIAAERFQSSIAAVTHTIAWFMAESTDEAHQTITAETRAIVRQLANDIVRTRLLRPIDMSCYVDSDMNMLYGRYCETMGNCRHMSIAEINAQLPRLFRFLLIATTIVAKYKMRVANATTTEVFFGVGERQAVCSASEMLTALAAMPTSN